MLIRQVVPRGLIWAMWGSAAAHAIFVVGLGVSATLSQRFEVRPQTVLTTKLVKLGKPRPEHYLPRKPSTPPPAPAVSLPAVGAQPTKPQPQSKAKPTERQPSAQDRLEQMRNVSTALDRLRKQVQQEAEGHPEGSAAGTVSDLTLATVGNLYATEIHDCLHANFAVEGLGRSQVEGLTATVHLFVQADGTFSGFRLQQGSGNAVYDESVLRAARRCGKVSPPPKELAAQILSEGLLVEFTP